MPSVPSRGRLARRVLSTVAVAAVAALTLSSCAGSDPAAEGDGELVWAIEGANLSAGHMDPQTSQLDVSAMVQRAVLDSLVFQEADGSFSPWLATSWEVEDGGATYVFHLRDDVTFHDGTPFDAAAVKANFDRIVDPATASAQAASMLGGDLYAGTDVVDEHTVRWRNARPNHTLIQEPNT
ncbi:ABC transporter substrate-binding protein, partial [Microbacterium testaceum]|uniref:ABC transporter substrate-binding protein n=1 Tax=Microbacterium testaceum TaxID=2033 RepID=UPI000AF33104